MKNRFGPTDEVGCFEMTGEGINEVPDPSGMFLSRGDAPVSGTCVTVTVEGKRPLIAEVQALVVKSSSPATSTRNQRSGFSSSCYVACGS